MKNIDNIFTETILELFLLNNKVLAYGDRLVADLGLTSARWQVLHYIAKSEQPQPVSWIARDMSSNRQNVQRIVNDLMKQQWVELTENPHHKTAQLVRLTNEGTTIYQKAMQLQEHWIHQLMNGLEHDDITALKSILGKIRHNLEMD